MHNETEDFPMDLITLGSDGPENTAAAAPWYYIYFYLLVVTGFHARDQAIADSG